MRFEPSGGGRPDWCLERIRVSAQAADGSTHKFDNLRLDKVVENRRLWFDQKYCKQMHLRRSTPDPEALSGRFSPEP
ncbi:hypothetical protein LE181_07755 [Streptomyces sp. SCA3-4]|uniref:hypothetical protein n=1 Tax=Streptomyces sichuanensis TaxID=2871810 RepID=UPI001CE35BE5|nr:hypothetical protein [Streptomyces sichuanensis]MCA6092057.1 hypothetical protein [Streptomyces sichuanensis]